MFSWYKCLIVSLFFSHLGFGSGNLFLIAPFPDLCLLVPFHYVNTLKQELDGTMAYLETDTDEMSIVNAHLNDLPNKFSVCVSEGQDKLPAMYWLPKLHKSPYKARFIANSSSCTTTTELSKSLTSCLTAIKFHVIRYCKTVYETSNKIGLGQFKILARCSVNLIVEGSVPRACPHMIFLLCI